MTAACTCSPRGLVDPWCVIHGSQELVDAPYEEMRTVTMSEVCSACVVSPSRTAHYQKVDGSEATICGLDATGDKWWWPS